MEEHSASDFLVLSCALVIAFAIVTVLLGALLIAFILPALAPADAVASTERTHSFPTNPPPDGSRYTWELFASGFDNPVFVTHAGDGTGRLFAVEQGGFIWIIHPDERQGPYPFLEMPLLTSPDVMRGTYSERGLLSIAFDPDYATNRTFYIAYTDRQGDSAIARVQTSR
ncbi:MAG: PQQ-dependent sugar dehydrogenase, partial [Anaerolinea sp.]|nr:PQQ-dependent sugar dehydrogenase [Anaerolinea sp.]